MSGMIEIKKGREKPIIQQHPWIFSGAIHEVRDNPTPGDIVTVVDCKGKFLARGYWNPKSQIQVRILTWQDEEINEEWWRRMLRRAIDARSKIYDDQDSYRVINAENDYLPGLVVDKYYDGQAEEGSGGYYVIQSLTLGIERQKEMLVRLLSEMDENFHTTIAGIYERSDVDVRGKEGLKTTTGLLWGEEPKKLLQIGQGYRGVLVDIRNGHKTGYYLDQRDNRILLHKLMEEDRSLPGKVLNLFSYTGGFGLYVPRSHIQHVTNVDASEEALEVAEENFKLNQRPIDRVEFIQADVFDYLRDQVEEGNQWDVVVLDPPKFAQSAKQVEAAARGYKDINLNAFKCVKSGGYLMTFSCSGAISADLFQKIVFGALADSGRQAQILKHLGPGDDHPVALTFPEGAYLKGLLLRVY